MSRLGLEGLVLISRIPSSPMVFLVSSHTIKLGWMSLFFVLLSIIRFLFQHVFHFNGIELCPTIKEFGAIIGKPEINDLIFPTMGEDLPSLLQVVLAIFSTMTNRWCVLASSTIGWFLSIFPVQPFLWVRGHIHTFFAPFAYVLLQGISWFKSHIM